MKWYGYLADAIVAAHVAYVSFVVVGQLVILIGWLRRWAWIRNFWFRSAHFTAMAIVAVESIFGVVCPLTEWEDNLRTAAGQTVEQGTFIGRFLHHLMFFSAEPWVFTTAYLLFTMFIVVTLVTAPPRLPRRANQRSSRNGVNGSEVCFPHNASVSS